MAIHKLWLQMGPAWTSNQYGFVVLVKEATFSMDFIQHLGMANCQLINILGTRVNINALI
jgi:hypothetical protein